MHRHENQFDCRDLLLDLFRRLDAIKLWHRNVQDHEVRLEVDGGFDESPTVFHRGD